MQETHALYETEPAHAYSPWWSINGLGLYVLLMYGITYYAIATAAPRIAAEFGVSTPAIFGFLSAALLLTALLAPVMGRWTDRIGSARVLLAGALARAVALVAMASAPDFVMFAVAFMAVQILGQVTEYDATFAAAVDVAGDHARQAMSQITLWGGLASTAFWPATVFLLELGSWRQMCFLYAAVIVVVCVPIAVSLHRLQRHGKHPPLPEATFAEIGNRATASTPPKTAYFLLLAMAFAFGGIAYNLPTLMLPVLEGLGLGTSAVIAGMLFGPSQTAGRLFEFLFGRRMSALRVAVTASAILALSLAVLLAGTGIVWTAFLFAVLYGAGAGVSYVVRGSVVLELYGRTDYALRLGRIGSVRLIVSAASPFVLSLVLEHLGAASVVGICLAAAILSLACFVLLQRYRPTS